MNEDYISFETAKLLKEKGFNISCRFAYTEKGNEFNTNVCCDVPVYAYKPTLQMAMKWLREVYHIIIVPQPLSFNKVKDCLCDNWVYSLWIGDNLEVDESLRNQTNYPTYEEACEAAIKYCLKNLINNEDEEEESDISVPKTVNEAISTLEKILSDEDKEYLLKNGAISAHSSLGRWIRNEWGLWTDSKLKDELKKKGFEHPDDMSNYIIEEFIKYWNNKI